MEVILALATILGGLAAAWYFYDKWKTGDRTSPTPGGESLNDSSEIPLNTHGARKVPIVLKFSEDIRAAVQEITPDHRLPEVKDISGDWVVASQCGILEPYYCGGDFFGGNFRDHAVVVLAEKPKGYKVLVIPNRGRVGVPVVTLVDQSENRAQSIYIRTVKAGKYQTAYGKGYELGEGPKTVRIRTDAIDFGKVEGANAYWYWDKKVKRFVKMPMSD